MQVSSWPPEPDVVQGSVCVRLVGGGGAGNENTGVPGTVHSGVIWLRDPHRDYFTFPAFVAVTKNLSSCWVEDYAVGTSSTIFLHHLLFFPNTMLKHLPSWMKGQN